MSRETQEQVEFLAPREEYISAEWYGPIEPPIEPGKTVADQWVEGFGGEEFSTLEAKK